MNFLMLYLYNIILPSPLLAQLELFKTAIQCFISIRVLVLCCKLISGQFTIELDIISKLNLLIITLYQNMKIPSPPVWMNKEIVIFQNIGGFYV